MYYSALYLTALKPDCNSRSTKLQLNPTSNLRFPPAWHIGTLCTVMQKSEHTVQPANAQITKRDTLCTEQNSQFTIMQILHRATFTIESADCAQSLIPNAGGGLGLVAVCPLLGMEASTNTMVAPLTRS